MSDEESGYRYESRHSPRDRLDGYGLIIIVYVMFLCLIILLKLLIIVKIYHKSLIILFKADSCLI